MMVAVGSEQRERLFSRLLNHPRLQRLLEQQGIDLSLRSMVTIYRVRRTVPLVRPLITNRQQLRELRALRLANRGVRGPLQQTGHVIHNNDRHTHTRSSDEQGGISW